MLVVLIILSIGLLGLIIYFAVSKKSTRLLKMAATIALGLIGLAILICGIFIIKGPKNDPNAALARFMTAEESQAITQSFNFTDLIILIILLGIITLVIVRSMREQKKMAKAIPDKKPKTHKPEEINLPQQESDDSILNLDDDSFDLGLD